MHYVWLYEGSQWKTKLYAALALLLILAVVFFPIWPYKLRLGVWYLSMGALGVLGLFFTMAIFRLLLFLCTMFTVKPGLWLYPNLFEDVGFFDSFKPVWAWQETKESKDQAKKLKKEKKKARSERRKARVAGVEVKPRVQEVDDDEEEEGESGEEDSGDDEHEEISITATGVEPVEGHVTQRGGHHVTVEDE